MNDPFDLRKTPCKVCDIASVVIVITTIALAITAICETKQTAPPAKTVAIKQVHKDPAANIQADRTAMANSAALCKDQGGVAEEDQENHMFLFCYHRDQVIVGQQGVTYNDAATSK